MRIILYILQKEFIQVFRNRTMLPIIFIVPIFQLLVLSFTATFEIKNVNLFVVDQDNSPSSREIIAKFRGSPFFTIADISGSYDQAEQAIINRKAEQLIQIPAGFEKGIISEKIAHLQVTTNAINGSAASLMNAYALNIIRDYNMNIIVEQLGLRQPPDPIKISSAFWYNPELNYFTYMVPGILVLLVTVIAAFLSAMNIVREKHQHDKKVTPAEEASSWLPLVHIVIGNMKTFLNGTFHGVTHRYLQEYLDEFCYRFNRRFWESELPLRLLNACLSHAPVSN